MRFVTVLAATLDGFDIGIPAIGLGTGWLVALMFVVALLRGNLITKTAHTEALEQSNHDRLEWRSESRIKDAQISEKDEQLREKDKQLALLQSVASTVEKVLTALQKEPPA